MSINRTPVTEDYLTLFPAYGRDYTSAQAIERAFREGLDFELARTGQKCSIEDFALGTKVVLRYNKTRDAKVVTVRAIKKEVKNES